MKSLKIITTIIQKIISIINIFLIIIIILNLLNLLNLILSTIQDNTYITFLDYTYRIIEEDNNYFDFKKGDFLLIDLNKPPVEEDLVLFNNNETLEFGKVVEQTSDITTIEIEGETLRITQDQILGTHISTIHHLGDILYRLLSPTILIAAIIILIFTSVMQIFINKTKVKLKQPDFKKYNNPV